MWPVAVPVRDMLSSISSSPDILWLLKSTSDTPTGVCVCVCVCLFVIDKSYILLQLSVR